MLLHFTTEFIQHDGTETLCELLTIAHEPFLTPQPQGIMHLYVENANFYVDNRLKKHQASKISRRDFEVRVLQQLSLSNLTIEYKLAWMNAVSPISSLLPQVNIIQKQ